MKKIFIFVIIIIFASTFALAKPCDSNRAGKAVRGWLKMTQYSPMDMNLGRVTKRIDTFTDSSGEPVYYIVYLDPCGYVIVPADDEVEPVIGFSSESQYNPSPDNPMGALVSADMASRVTAARREKHDPANSKYTPFINARSKWQNLELLDDATVPLEATHVSSVSDVRVSPLVLSKWNQGSECSNQCYNIYTPNNYPCGCVATAMSQLMRFYQYPPSPSTLGPFTISVSGVSQQRSLMGGSYAWSDMVLDPDCSTTLTQRQAIGVLTHDAGVAVNMDYASGGSGANTLKTAQALKEVFGYLNAVKGYNGGSNISESNLNTMLNPNLDAGFPCLLGITGTPGGHAIVCDGYGYNMSTLYHHLNMGWSGSNDAWYDLPDIDTSIGTFASIYKSVYNVYVAGSGEIISGRVTYPDGSPINGATVTTGGGAYTAVTNAKGIYALAHVPANSNYTVQAFETGYSFTARNVTTAASTDYSTSSGNVWGIDFVAVVSNPEPPVAQNGSVGTKMNTPVTITLAAQDDDLPNPPGSLTYIITSLPSDGELSDINNGVISSVPYSLPEYQNQVVYTPVSCFTGSDSFQFKANDGGSAPNGGDSNFAAVSIMVNLGTTTIFSEDFESGLGEFTIDNTFGNGSGLWHLTTSCNSAQSGHSAPTALYYGQDSSCDYNAGNTEGAVTSPIISLAEVTEALLEFKYMLQTENLTAYDFAFVEVSQNGGSFVQYLSNTADTLQDPSNGWIPGTLDLSSMAGSNIQIRFRFKTVDSIANTYSGFYVDDIKITGKVALSDMNCDSKVNLADFSILAKHWMQAGCITPDWCEKADINMNGNVGLSDLIIFAGHWLEGTQITAENIVEPFESGDFSAHPWQHLGNAPWVIVSDIKYEGIYAAKSGTITHSQSSTMEVVIDAPEFNTIRFACKVSSEGNYDYLGFYVDGVERASWSGNQEWAEHTYTITPGQHTFKWSYTKDGSVNTGSDCAWVDDIEIFWCDNCGGVPFCGDGTCDPGEEGWCVDCGGGQCNFNGMCEPWEDMMCPDCGGGPCNNNGMCEPWEDPMMCPDCPM